MPIQVKSHKRLSSTSKVRRPGFVTQMLHPMSWYEVQLSSFRDLSSSIWPVVLDPRSSGPCSFPPSMSVSALHALLVPNCLPDDYMIGTALYLVQHGCTAQNDSSRDSSVTQWHPSHPSSGSATLRQHPVADIRATTACTSFYHTSPTTA